MPEEDKKSGEDLEDHHAADDDNVDDIDDNDVDVDDKDDDKDDDSEKDSVPVHVVKSMRKELQGVKKRLSLTQQQLLATKKEKEKEDPFADMEDDDVLTVKDLKELQSKMASEESGRYDPAAEAEFAATVDDYEETVGKHLPKLIKENPGLAQTIEKSENPFQVAYELGKIAKSNSKPTEDDTEKAIRKAKKNAKKPGSPSASPGGEPSERFKGMSDDDLETHIAKVKGSL